MNTEPTDTKFGDIPPNVQKLVIAMASLVARHPERDTLDMTAAQIGATCGLTADETVQASVWLNVSMAFAKEAATHPNGHLIRGLPEFERAMEQLRAKGIMQPDMPAVIPVDTPV